MIRYAIFGGPWKGCVFTLEERAAEDFDECDVPDVECSVCDRRFEEGDQGIVLTREVRIAWGRHVSEGVMRVATHRECLYWAANRCCSGYCNCDHPDEPVRVLAVALWQATAAQWN